jgi:prephenate dehydratase
MDLNVIGEIYYRIHHCLIGTGSIEDIDTVYSHPQALGQCRQFIQENSLKTIPSYDTAGSVKIIKDLNKDSIACIASRNAAEIFGVAVIQEGIENNTNNYTRFLVFSKEKNDKTENSKTSIIFSVKHEAGALYQIIKEFHQYKINLTKIESRPNKNTPWEYNFYVDFEGHQDDSSIKDMLKKLRDNSTFLKILGSYPIAKLD